MEKDMDSYIIKGSAKDWLQEHTVVRKGTIMCALFSVKVQ